MNASTWRLTRPSRSRQSTHSWVCCRISDAVKVRALLKQYLDQRTRFYTLSDARQLAQTNATTSQLQHDLWSTIQERVETQPTPVGALIARGMNEVLDSRTRTQAAWWNRHSPLRHGDSC